MSQPDPNACCPDAYFCPTAGETECPRHGGFDVCCDKTAAHVPIDRQTWNLAQERLEQKMLTAFINRRRTYSQDPETMRRILLQEQPARV